MVASEAAPFAKTGGLADVVGSLPAALQKLGHEIAVLLPCYQNIDLSGAALIQNSFPLWVGASRFDAELYRIDQQVCFYFLNCPRLFLRDGYYGNTEGDFPDNHIRFAGLALAALTIARYIFRPNLFHCHDWQAGLVPAYLRSTFANDPTFMGIRTLFTIHNLGYQGLFPKKALPEVGLDRSLFHLEGLEFFGKVNFLKAGLVYSDALNTVSRTYAREIQTPEYGFGLDGVLRARRHVLHGILNGADYSEWDPRHDPHIAAPYSADDLSGKRACKEDLLREFDIPLEAIERPLLGIVSRLTSQKGLDLVLEIADELAVEDLTVVTLGTGELPYEAAFSDLALQYPEKFFVRIGYDNVLAHKIEAGADMFLMPSRYEPSGLNQIYSLRYGTVPIVRATGGLDDTIEEDTGFKFTEYSGQALLGAIRVALAVYADGPAWREIMRRNMQKDFSWDASARAYSALYQELQNAATP